MTPQHRPDRLVSNGCLAEARSSARPRLDELTQRLLGPGRLGSELPPLTDLLASLLALGELTRRKALLSLSSSTGEFALVRRGEHVLVSYYDAGSVPQIFVRDRAVELRELLALAAAAALEADVLGLAALDAAGLAIAERARRLVVTLDTHTPPSFAARRGGALRAKDKALAFGFHIQLPSSDAPGPEVGPRADVHALLFDGELWGYANGRRIPLVRGPIFPAVLRMVSAARGAVEAWEAQRPVHLKLKAGEFGIALRLAQSGEARVTLMGLQGEAVTLPALDLSSALMPILRVGAELVRAVVTADRAQSKNLRLTSLRDDVRALRRIVRTRAAQQSFVNRDPELLRASLSSAPRERESSVQLHEPSGRLRLSLRWRAEVDGLDASSTFLCGDRLLVATPRTQLALAREDGELLWMRERRASTTLMAGTSLLSITADGEIALCSLEDGETYARTRIAPRLGAPMLGVFAGARGAPPLAVLTEGRDRLVAIDVRTGSARWSFRSAGRGDFRLTRAGRILLVASGDGTLDAIDISTGEVVWRWSGAGRIQFASAVTREHAIAIAQHGATCSLLCFDLFSGELAFKRELAGSALSAPIATDALALVSLQASPTSLPELVACELGTGQERWRAPDPGMADGGAPLVVDQHLVINAPSGHTTALELASGELRWQHRLADPTRDDVPRRFEPVLRGGALFLPSASVHVVRPTDGSLIGGPIAERIIPDFMRVDERGWLYVAEESGMIEAHAPIPTLRLVKH